MGIQQSLFMATSPVVGGAYATWNPADKGANITLSGGNLSAFSNGAAGALVRSTVSVTTSKWYWETIVNTATDEPGIANASASTTAYAGNDPNAWCYFGGASPGIYNNGTRIFTCLGFTTGDVIGIALDPAAGTCAFYKNNVLQATVTGLAAVAYYAMWSCSPAGGGTSATNFGATAFVYSPPGGFNAGLYTP